jgi:hypothetical protein
MFSKVDSQCGSRSLPCRFRWFSIDVRLQATTPAWIPAEDREEIPMPTRKYLVFLRSVPGKQEQPPSPAQMQEIYAAFGAWKNKFEANILDLGGKLKPGGRILTAAGVTDGPFSEAKEVVGGYMVIAAESYDGAIEVARECPGVVRQGSDSAKVPADLRDLLPFAQRWGIGDDVAAQNGFKRQLLPNDPNCALPLGRGSHGSQPGSTPSGRDPCRKRPPPSCIPSWPSRKCSRTRSLRGLCTQSRAPFRV